MAARRPTSVLVVAILQIVFGSLGVLCGACAPLGLIQQQNAAQDFRSGPKNGLSERQREAFARFAEKSNANLPFTAGAMALSLLGAILMLSGGIGLLNMKPWGRPVTMAWGGLAIVYHLGSFGYLAGVTYPQMNEFMTEFKGGGNSPVADAMLIGMQAGMITGIAVGVLSIFYAAFILFLINRPEVVAAFSGERTRRAFDEDGDGRPEIDR